MVVLGQVPWVSTPLTAVFVTTGRDAGLRRPGHGDRHDRHRLDQTVVRES
jgi:hypothetical protein